MSENYKLLEGAVNVNADITPISRQPIDQLDSSKWSEMTIGELLDQRTMLANRIARAQTMGSLDMATQMNRGLQYLDALIKATGSDEDHLI